MFITGSMCAHKGCTKTFNGKMPKGWAWVISYYAPEPELYRWKPKDWARKTYRDIALCPDHVEAHSALLKFHLRNEHPEAITITVDWNAVLNNVVPDETVH